MIDDRKLLSALRDSRRFVQEAAFGNAPSPGALRVLRDIDDALANESEPDRPAYPCPFCNCGTSRSADEWMRAAAPAPGLPRICDGCGKAFLVSEATSS